MSLGSDCLGMPTISFHPQDGPQCILVRLNSMRVIIMHRHAHAHTHTHTHTHTQKTRSHTHMYTHKQLRFLLLNAFGNLKVGNANPACSINQCAL